MTKLGIIDFAYVNDVGFRTKGTKVASLDDAQAGDVICYDGHVAFYDGHGGIIHEANEQEDCKHGSNAAYTTILTIRRFVDSNSSSSSRTYNNDVFNTEKSTVIKTQQNMPVPEGDNRTYRAVQSACFDGKYVICAQNKNYKDSSGNYTWNASSKGGRIAWFNMETGKYETSIEIGSEGGHMDGVAYDSDRNMVLKPVNSKQGNLLQIDNNTKKIVGYTKMSDYCNKLTYVPSRNQLVGLKDGKFIFMSYRESENKYVKDNEVKLEDYHTNCGAQGIGTDGQCIYIADSGPDDSSSKYRVWTYTLDGEKVEEHKIGDVHTGSAEVESAFGDNNGNLWLVLPRGIERVLNYTTNSTETSQNSNNATNSGDFVVKVATWQENSEVVNSTDSSENRNEHNYNMSTKTIPYQNAISQYRMPFNYLWAMLLISQDKKYTFDLADLVRNSKIEITIHDNLEETTTKTTETYNQKYIYKGSADIKMECMEVPNTQQNPGIYLPPATPITFNVTKNGSGQDTVTSTYKKVTTTVNKVNTLDVALTLADTWCVKYEKEYEYDGKKTENSKNTETIDIPKVEGEEENKITNSNLLNKIIKNAKNKMNSERVSPATVTNSKIAGNEKQKVDIEATTKKITTEVTTVKSSYTGKPEKFTEDIEGKGKFVDVFNRYYKARSNILSTKDWLFEILESNEDTVNMVDLTKYLMYRATGTPIDGVITYSFSEYNLNNFSDIGGGSLEGNTTEERVWLALINAGFNDVAAAGAMGNLSYESGGSGTKTIKTDVVEGGYTETNGGIGMCQWTNNGRGSEGRNTQLRKYAQSKGKTWKDEETQIEFLITEITGNGKAKGYASYQFMETTYGGVTYSRDAVKNVDNNPSKVDYATKAFAATFERPSQSAFSSSIQTRIELANYFYSKYKGKRSSSSSFGPSSAYANKSPEEKVKFLFPNGQPKTKEEAESYLTTIDIPITQKDGTKSTRKLQLHKAIAKDVYNACLAAQNAGFKIYEIGSYRTFGTDSAGGSGGLSYSQHCYGLAVDINVNENCYIGYNGAVGPGSFWKPNENEYSISPDGVLYKTFKSMGWGWGGDWTSPKDYMHFSFMGT